MNDTDKAHAVALNNAQSDVPEDGPSRPIVRLGVILAGAYDLPVESGVDYDPELPVVDLLTDVLHWCLNEGIDIDVVTDRANQMLETEREEWGL